MSGSRASHRDGLPVALLGVGALTVGALGAGVLTVGPLVLLVPPALGALGVALVLLFDQDAPIG